MSLIRKAFNAPILRDRKELDVFNDDAGAGWQRLSGTRGDAPQEFHKLTIEGLRQNPVVSGCLRVLASNIADAPLMAEEPDPDEEGSYRAVKKEHPAQALIEMPNARDPWIALLERGVYHFMLGGNLVWRKIRNPARMPVALMPVRPDRVQSALVGEDEIPIAYKIQKSIPGAGGSSGIIDTVSADDIVLIPDVDPLNAVFGMPRLASAGMEIRSDNEASDYSSEVLTNHGMPAVIIGVDARQAKPEVLDAAEERWQEKFGPGRGRGRAAFLPAAQTFKEIGFNLKDLEFPSLRMITREGICAALGVDAMMLGISSASRGGTLGGAEHKEASKKLWRMTIMPIMRRWAAFLNLHLAPEFGYIRYRFDTSEIDALKEDRGEQIKRGRDMAEAGVYSPQEIRAESGRDPRPPEDHETIIKTAKTTAVPVDSIFEEDWEDPNAPDLAALLAPPPLDDGVDPEDEPDDGDDDME